MAIRCNGGIVIGNPVDSHWMNFDFLANRQLIIVLFIRNTHKHSKRICFIA